MMDVNINLLPQNKRLRLKRLTIFLFSKNILAWLVIGASIIAMIFLWGWLTLIDEFQNLSGSTTLINREYTRYNKEIRTINKIIHELNKTENNYEKIVPKFVELTQNLPTDIKLNNINLSLKNKKIEIAGIAETREALLNYQEKLKEIPWIGEVNIPTNQLFNRKDISFNFNTTIK